MSAIDEAAKAHAQFMANCENAIAYNLKMGYRGMLYCWVEIVGQKLIFHAARKPPVGDDGRYQWNVLGYDLSDESKAQEMLRKYRATRGEP